MILQKTYRTDFRTKISKENRGEVRKYYVENSHEAIIDQETFNRVQAEMTSRAAKYLQAHPVSYPHLFKGYLRCGHCGRSLKYYRTNTGKYDKAIWGCPTFYNMGKALCPSQKIPEDVLIEKTKEVIFPDNQAELTREIIVERIAEIIAPGPHRLIYRLRDGTEMEIEWQHKSRRESWTPEMRQAARERALKQHSKEVVE